MNKGTRAAYLVLVFVGAAVAVYLAYLFGFLDVSYLVTAWIGDGVAAAITYLLTKSADDKSRPGGPTPPGEIHIHVHPPKTKTPKRTGSKRPTFELRPLPDYQGHMVGPSPAKVVENPDGTKSASMVNDAHATTPEFALLAQSQHWFAAYGPVDRPLKEVVAKFGVVRVLVRNGPALKCHAEIRYRHRPVHGEPVDVRWIDAGHLNWFSVRLKSEAQGHVEEIDKARGNGLNAYLRNPTEDIYEGEERDLLLNYMFLGDPFVFLCTDSGSGSIGYVYGAKPLTIFEVEIGIAAENAPRSTFRFLVTARWDYNKIQELHWEQRGFET